MKKPPTGYGIPSEAFWGINPVNGSSGYALNLVVGVWARSMNEAFAAGPFAQNLDEFIGLPEERTSAELANPLSMAERWFEMDRQMDYSLDYMIAGGADAGGTDFWDVMGRAGRATQEIISGGGTRGLSQNIDRGLLIGSASQSGNQAALQRSVPFGMAVLPGEML
jgi:hypothetical protein